jgi:hypothetical protein
LFFFSGGRITSPDWYVATFALASPSRRGEAGPSHPPAVSFLLDVCLLQPVTGRRFSMYVRNTAYMTAQAHPGIAAQVAFERHILKPGLMFKGKSLKPPGYQAPFSCRSGGANAHPPPPRLVVGGAAAAVVLAPALPLVVLRDAPDV